MLTRILSRLQARYNTRCDNISTSLDSAIVTLYERHYETVARATMPVWAIANVETIARKHDCSFTVALEIMRVKANYIGA